MISAQKLKLIHVGRRELGLTEEAYREILRHHGGVESSKDLDDEGFKRVIDCLKALGFWVRRSFEQEKPRDPGALPTIGQMKVIAHLWVDLSEYLAGANRTQFQRAFYQDALKIPALGPQTRAQANKVIEVLKQRVQRKMRRATSLL
jgi:phage gp16-like protein